MYVSIFSDISLGDSLWRLRADVANGLKACVCDIKGTAQFDSLQVDFSKISQLSEHRFSQDLMPAAQLFSSTAETTNI